MLKRIVLPLTFLVLVITVLILEFPRFKLLFWGVSIDLSDWQSYNTGDSGNDYYIEVTSGPSKVVITKSSPENHQKFVNDKKVVFSSLFEPIHSPYPEVITNVINCGEEFKPKEESVKNGTIYSLFAGERYNYGICSRDLVKYYSRHSIFDCGQKGIFEVDVFSREEGEVEKIAKSFSCNL